MDLYLLYAAVRARLGLFLLTLALALAAGSALALLWPRSWRATASLLVAESISANVLPERMAYLQTQADMLGSDNVARRVVQRLRLADDARARATWQELPQGNTYEDWLVARWVLRPKVELRQSSVVQVSIDADDAATAAATANAYAQAYLELARELRSDNARRSEALLDDRLAALRDEARQAQAQLVAFQRQHGILSLDGLADGGETRLAMLGTQLAKAREDNLEQTGRQQHLRRWMEARGPLEQLQEVQLDPQVQRLSGELQHSQARLEALMQQYGSAYPPYLQQRAEHELRRAALEEQVRKVLSGLDQAAAQSRWRAGELQAELEAQRQRLLAARAERGELATLAHRAESTQRTYDMAVQRFVVDMVGSQVFRADVSLLSAAGVPLRPRSPRALLMLGGALGCGVLLGLGLVGALELIDRRVRRDTDLQELLPDDSAAVPLLAMTTRWQPPADLVADWQARAGEHIPPQAAH